MTEKIAAVIDSFDEAGLEPANYVVELAGGRFEARVWDISNECELTLGTCDTCGEATHMVWAYSDQIMWLVHWFPGPAEYLRPH
jgi:hypothetical protein